MTATLDDLGPVDWIVVEFPGSKMTGEIAPILQGYVDRGLIRVLDLLVLKKDDDGALEAFEISDLDQGELGGLRTLETELAMLLSEQDVEDLAVTIEPGSSAAVLVWENLWAAPFGAAVRHAGASWPPAAAFPFKRCSQPWRLTPKRPKESDMPLAARRRRRTVAAVGGAVVVAHGVNRRRDRREDRRDDRGDRREDRRDR